MAIRLDGTFSTFNSHRELACRANTQGDCWKGAGETDIPFLILLPVSRGSAFRCAVTITTWRGAARRGAAHPKRAAAAAAPRSSRGPGNHCVSHGPKTFRIYRSREGVQNASALQRFARSSYLSSSLGFSPQDAISLVEVMRWLKRECRFSVSLKIYLDLRFQILFLAIFPMLFSVFCFSSCRSLYEKSSP